MLSKCCNSRIKSQKKIGGYPERITKIKGSYNQEEINYPSERDGWKKFEKNNLTIALNVLYAKKKKKHIQPMF